MTERQYSVPVRLNDNHVVYDNQDTLDQLQVQRRCGHRDVGEMTATSAGYGRLKQVPSTTSDVGDGRIMRFVELRQVRAANDRQDLWNETGRQGDFRSHATEDRYLVASTAVERSKPSHHLYYYHVDEPDAVYVNAENGPAWRTSASQQISSDPQLEEDAAYHLGTGTASKEGEQPKESCEENAELSHEKEQLDEDSSATRSATNPDFCENATQKTKNDDLRETGSTTQSINQSTTNEMSDDSSLCRESSRSRPPNTTRAPPAAQFRLKDSYLLRMSPPPPSQQTDGRRRAAYSDPVRWVSPISGNSNRPTDRQRQQAETTPSSPPNMTRRQGTSGRPNGFRPHAVNESGGGVTRTAAMTCTNEALDEAIRRRNRKCKPSAMRRLQAAKAIGGGEPEMTTTSSSFDPIFEGVMCSLRTRSASLSDCNALAKERGHTLHFWQHQSYFQKEFTRWGFSSGWSSVNYEISYTM